MTVAEAGTVRRLVSVEVNVTVTFVGSVPEIPMEYDTGADPSLTCGGPDRRSLVSSLSVTAIELLAGVQFASEAVMPTKRVPSIFWLSNMVTLNTAEVAPAER